jgi:hypothetical protein
LVVFLITYRLLSIFVTKVTTGSGEYFLLRDASGLLKLESLWREIFRGRKLSPQGHRSKLVSLHVQLLSII